MLKYVLYFLIGSGLIASITLIAERASPRLAGILMALPTITFFSLLFMALEHGVEFAGSAAMWNPLGIVADVVFLELFVLGTRISTGNRALIIALLLAFAGYFSGIFLLRFLPLENGFQALALLWLSCIAAYISFRKLADIKFDSRAIASWQQILFRGSFGGIVISGVIFLGDVAGSLWGGIFSSFPGTITPVLILLYSSHGREMTDSVIRDSPIGLAGTGLYSCMIWLLYPVGEILSGTLGAILILIAFLLTISFFRTYFEQQ